MPIKKTELPDGLRVLSERITSVRSIAIGVWVDVGSRNESIEEGGVSHLIEHMHFKGTRTRSALKLADEIEQLGGALNAFTTREQTCYYARILDEHLPQAIEVLSDMLMNSTFTPTNLKKEKQVVLEEIKETEDTPSDLVHDHYAAKFWGDHPLGRPILGESKRIAEMPRKTIMNYIHRHYTAPKVVVAAAGNVKHEDLLKLVNKHFKLPSASSPPAEVAKAPETSRIDFIERDIAQNHFVMGFPSIEFAHKKRFAALGLNFYLGGGMSSALFQDIREKRGLAYSVYSFQDFYRDAGSFGIYLSTDGRSLPLALELIKKHIRKLKRKAISGVQLDKIKAQIKGSLTFSMESATGRMNRLARHEMMLGRYSSLKNSFKLVDEMTATDLVEAANMIFDENRMIAVSLGPVTEKDFDLPSVA